MVCGLTNHSLFSFPSNNLSLLIIRPCWLRWISKTRLLKWKMKLIHGLKKRQMASLKNFFQLDQWTVKAVICANALYFKGAWKEKFDASITKYYDLLDGTSVKAPS